MYRFIGFMPRALPACVVFLFFGWCWLYVDFLFGFRFSVGFSPSHFFLRLPSSCFLLLFSWFSYFQCFHLLTVSFEVLVEREFGWGVEVGLSNFKTMSVTLAKQFSLVSIFFYLSFELSEGLFG